MSLMLVKIWQTGNSIDNKALPYFGSGAALHLWLKTNSKIKDVKRQLNAKIKKPKLNEPYRFFLFTSARITNIKPLGDDMILGKIGVPRKEQVRNHKKPVRMLELYVTGAYTIFNKNRPANNPANFTTHVLKNKINF